MMIRKAILMTVLLMVLAFCGGCVEGMHLKLANGMLDWEFKSKTADSYRIGSWTGTEGRAFDALYWDTVSPPSPLSTDQLAREIELRLAELERAVSAAEDDDNGNGD